MKTKALSLSLILLFIFVSCQKEDFGIKSQKEIKQFDAVVKATVEQHADTRTTLDTDGARVLWSDGDSFVAFSTDGDASRFDLTEGAGTCSAEFSGTFAGEGPYTLLYPYSENAALSDGTLSFKLPHEQKYLANSFAAGVSPAIATCMDGQAADFRNLCGVLKLTVKGKGQQLSKIVLQDLAGNMLWGDASVRIDGTQGTDAQTMTLTGGDNTLVLTMGGVTINTTTTKTFYFIVPAGTLDRGFSLAFHTIKGVVGGFLETQCPNTAARSVMRAMPVATTSTDTEPADELARGYYKDLFMDSGIYLSSRKTLPSSEYLGISMEFFASNANAKLEKADTTYQKEIMVGSDIDSNGVLLYPDGEPRFRVIYVNGGNSRNHGQSLYPQGLNNITTFVDNGGSYTGSCAGSFLASKGYDSNYPYKYYTNVWPGHTYHTRTDGNVSVKDAYTSLTPEPGNPLLKYFDPGSRIDHVRHNGGSYINPADADTPIGTEILMRYYTPGPDSTKLHNSVNAWAYKGSVRKGRVVISGSHPEGITEGKQLYYMAAMLSYAMDGNAPADVKNINFGSTVTGKVGDKQYHHYKFTLPSDKSNVKITLSSDSGVKLFLTLRKGGKAFFTDAEYTLTSSGANKELFIKNLEAGDWYVGVYCATTVTSTQTSYSSAGLYYKYTGHTEVLNGIEYTLSTWTRPEDIPAADEDEFTVKDGTWS